MTKKTSLLLAALCAVSGMSTCHARVRIDKDNNGVTRDRSWWWKGDPALSVSGPADVYDDNTVLIAQINTDTKQLISMGYNKFVSLDETDSNVGTIAQQYLGALIGAQNLDELKADNATIESSLKGLKDLLEKAKKLGIDVSSMNTGKQSTSAPEHHPASEHHSAASHSSGGSHSGHSGSRGSHGARY